MADTTTPDSGARFGARTPYFLAGPYDADCKRYLKRSAHYLQNALPGAFFAIHVRESATGLFGEAIGVGPLRGLCLLGRPIARALPQDGSMAEVTRFVLDDGFPRGTASALLRHAFSEAARRGIRRVDALHDRTRHTGAIYRKAGMHKVRKSKARVSGWESRARSTSAVAAGKNPKMRWTIVLQREDVCGGIEEVE